MITILVDFLGYGVLGLLTLFVIYCIFGIILLIHEEFGILHFIFAISVFALIGRLVTWILHVKI